MEPGSFVFISFCVTDTTDVFPSDMLMKVEQETDWSLEGQAFHSTKNNQLKISTDKHIIPKTSIRRLVVYASNSGCADALRSWSLETP